MRSVLMKKKYEKPVIEIEAYVLSAAIASNCGETVSLGPEAPDKTVCDEFKGAFDVFSIKPGLNVMATGGTPFYADGAANCDCYYSSGGGSYFTS